MIVIVETNFIVQLVLQQEHSEACEKLVDYCSTPRGAQLAIPAFAITEAGMKIERRQTERKRFLRTDFATYGRENQRSKLFRRYESAVEDLEKELVRADAEEASRWRDFQMRVLDFTEVIPLFDSTLEEALLIQLGREIKEFPDALILASLKKYLEDLRARGVDTPACFISTDRDFTSDSVLPQLRKLGCKYISSFENAAARVRRALRVEPPHQKE
jgi:predicted nucleic acid-binding protein